MAKVIRASIDNQIVFENDSFIDSDIEVNRPEKRGVLNQQIVNRKFPIRIKYVIQSGNKIHTRYSKIILPSNERKIIQNKNFIIYFWIKKTEYKSLVITDLKNQERTFFLNENELISEVKNLLDKKYSINNFVPRMKVDNNNYKALAFINDKNLFPAKIIGFETAADNDPSFRLYARLNTYLTICDEVYLVVENKNVPIDLPFYVGIIRITDGVGNIVRYAQSLKHSVDVRGCWTKTLKAINREAKMDPDYNLISFFNAIESIKRKMLWNQYVSKTDKVTITSYIKLNTKEKRLLRQYFKRSVILDDKQLI